MSRYPRKHTSYEGNFVVDDGDMLTVNGNGAIALLDEADLDVADGAAINVATGGALNVDTGGIVDLQADSVLNIDGVDRIVALATAPAAVAAGYKIARGVDNVTGTLDKTTGLATVVAATAMLATDPVLGEATLVTCVIPAQSGGGEGHITLKTWKPTGAGDVTPIAGTAARPVSWIAVGT